MVSPVYSVYYIVSSGLDRIVIPVAPVCHSMPDDKNGRENQAANEERRQREREVAEALERGDEPEPADLGRESLGNFDEELEELNYPVTAAEVVDQFGDYEVETAEASDPVPVEDVLPSTDDETYESVADVRTRITRPTVGEAMARIAEASRAVTDRDRLGSQRDAYEKTLRSLQAIDADDEDEGIRVVTDWIVDYIHEKETRPSSRQVRRRAAKFCRENGYTIRTDDWLGA